MQILCLQALADAFGPDDQKLSEADRFLKQYISKQVSWLGTSSRTHPVIRWPGASVILPASAAAASAFPLLPLTLAC